MKLLNLFESRCGLCGNPVALTNIVQSKKAGLSKPACGECIQWAKKQASSRRAPIQQDPEEHQETIEMNRHKTADLSETKWGWAQRGEKPPKKKKLDPKEEARKKAEYEKYKKEKMDKLEKEYNLRTKYGVGKDPIKDNERLADYLLDKQKQADAEKERQKSTKVNPKISRMKDLERPTHHKTQKLRRRKFFPED